MEGKVKWFNRKKAYGFIEGEDGQEYFVHRSALSEGTFLKDNDRVSFEPAEGEKGKQAQKVVLLQKGSEIAAETKAKSDSEPEKAEEPAEEDSEEESAEEDQE